MKKQSIEKTQNSNRRKLSLSRETLQTLRPGQLGGVAGAIEQVTSGKLITCPC